MFDALAFDASAFNAPPDIDPNAPWVRYAADDAAPNYDTATTTGGVVDSSGRGQPNAIPSTTAVRPTLNAGGAGGHAYLTFDGADDRLNTSNVTGTILAFGNNKPGLTVSMVMRLTTTTISTTKTLVFFTVGTGNGTRFAINADVTGVWNVGGRRLDADATVNMYGPPIDTDLHHIVGVNDYAGQEQRLYIDGQLVASQAAFPVAGNTSATDSQVFMWGANATPAQWVPAEFYELAPYDRPFTDADVADLWATIQPAYALAQGTAHPLTATGTATTSGSAAIDTVTAVSLTASGTATSSGSAAIGRLAGLGATGTATSTGSAAIITVRPITASGQASSSGSAAITAQRPIAASGSTTSSGSAAIGQRQAVAASGTATTSGSAAIGAQLAFTAIGTSQSLGSAQLVGDVPLSGIGTAVSSGSAAIVVRRPITATGTATSTGSAAVGRARPVTADGSATSSGSGALRLRHALVATGTALTLGEAVVGLRLRLTATSTTTSSGSADIALGGFPQYQPGTSTLYAAPLGAAVLAPVPAAQATLTPAPAATAILEAPRLAMAALTTEG